MRLVSDTFRRRVRVWDNGGRTFDRYSFVFPDGDVLLVGPTGNHPQGVCMWAGEQIKPDGEPTSMSDVPLAAVEAAYAEWLEWYAPTGEG